MLHVSSPPLLLLLSLLVAAVPSLVSGSATAPEQIHIAYAGKDSSTGYPTGMTVSWATASLPAHTPIVSFGTQSQQYAQTQAAITVQYFDTYFHHHAVIPQLKPSTKYYFVVGDLGDAVQTEEFTFTTALLTANTDVRVVIIGDMGVGKNSASTMAKLAQVCTAPDVDFLWHIGDISYADDAFVEHPFSFEYEDYWNMYMNQVQNFTAVLPYMVLPGNHEAECHSPACDVSSDRLLKLANFSAYNHRFRMPSEESEGVLNMWYSFNVGPIHFVNIDTETDYPGAPIDHYNEGPTNGGFGDQLSWLKQDLEQANEDRAIRPWIIVGGHRPVYSITAVDGNGNPKDAYKTLQTAIEGILHDYKVDMFIAGHVHGYERQQPVFNNSITEDCSKSCVDPTGTIHIVDGGAGNIEGLTKYSGNPPVWNAAFNFDDFGYAVLSSKASSLEWSYFNDAGALLDSFTIQKSSSYEYQ